MSDDVKFRAREDAGYVILELSGRDVLRHSLIPAAILDSTRARQLAEELLLAALKAEQYRVGEGS